MHQKRLRIQGLEINGNNLRFYETILPTNFIYSAFSAWHRHKMFAFFSLWNKINLNHGSPSAAQQGWGTCGTRAKCGQREPLIWPASEFLLPMLEYNIASKQAP